MPTTLIRNATILTMNDALDIVEGAVVVSDGRIVSVGPEPDARFDHVVNAGGAYLLPGFIQTHVHLCQTLFRGYADDMPLLEWLRRRIWPMEAAHSPSTPACRGASCRRRAAALGHDHGADDGDRARHRRRVRDAGRDWAAGDRRQVHDGFRRQRAVPAPRGHATLDRRERRAPQTMGGRCGRAPARRLCAAFCRLLLSSPARGGRRALRERPRDRPHARLGIA